QRRGRVMSGIPRRAWSEGFRRGRISPHVFVVAENAAKEVDHVVAGRSACRRQRRTVCSTTRTG
ncbi:hypothetical protein ONA70_13305, partial [Micromonospora yasonensis]|uniref:hypothetical protein n=1 Tax=Micromonospora yasonensis TaxID=1128667 RepID=UPI00222F55DD